jgi:hypothetical protein
MSQTYIQDVRTRGYTKIHAYVLVPKSFMKFVFNIVQSNSKRFLCTSVHFNVGT